MIYNYTTHAPINIANTQLRALYQRYTPILNDPPCDTRPCEVNRFCNYIDNRLPEHTIVCVCVYILLMNLYL